MCVEEEECTGHIFIIIKNVFVYVFIIVKWVTYILFV